MTVITFVKYHNYSWYLSNLFTKYHDNYHVYSQSIMIFRDTCCIYLWSMAIIIAFIHDTCSYCIYSWYLSRLFVKYHAYSRNGTFVCDSDHIYFQFLSHLFTTYHVYSQSINVSQFFTIIVFFWCLIQASVHNNR